MAVMGPGPSAGASRRAAALLALGAYGAYCLPALASIDAPLPALRPLAARLRDALDIDWRLRHPDEYALTFDDGPHAKGTPAVLAILAEAAVPATFFLVGEQVLRNPSLAAEIVAAGHRVGVHCHRHRNQLRLAPGLVREDIRRAGSAIEDATGLALRLYRPPYGVANAATIACARRQRLRTWLWGDWGRDWEARASADSIAALLLARATGGGVGLLHDADDYSAAGSWRRTAQALPRIIEELSARGLKLAALPE